MIEKLQSKHIVLAGCLLTLLYAIFSSGFYHSDEHYQILEYAHMKLFGTPTPDNLPWEFVLMMRSGVQPLIAYCVGWVLQACRLYDPHTLVVVLQLLSGAVSVAVMLFFFRTVKARIGGQLWEKWYLILGFFLWFMAYLHVHFSAEMLSGNLLLLLAALCLRGQEPSRKSHWMQGLLLGIVAGGLFITRFQMGFALAGFGLWLLVFDRKWAKLGGLLLGVVLMLGIGILTDRWLYGYWTCTPVNYLRENILNGHMDTFGLRPWHYYFSATLAEGAGVYGLIALVSMLWFIVRHPKHVISWMLIPFLAVHLMIGHKELRFLFPLLFFAPYFIVLFFRELPQRFNRSKAWRICVIVLAAGNALLILYALTIRSADVYFRDMMAGLSRNKQQVVLLNLKEERTYYSYPEWMVGPREVAMSFYLPANMTRHSFDRQDQLEAKAASLASCYPNVFILTADKELPAHSALQLEKLHWTPYPAWLVRYFNFNNWIEHSVGSKNIYRVTGMDGPNAGSSQQKPETEKN